MLTDCILWTGARQSKGYGHTRKHGGGKVILAHQSARERERRRRLVATR